MPEVELRKGTLSGWALYSAAVGIIVATGSLALNGVGMSKAGPGFILALVAACVMAIINSLVFSELGTTYPRAGSIMEYVSRAFGEQLGAAASLSYGIGLVLASAAEATVIGRLLNYMVPAIPWWAWSLIMITAMFLINLGSIDLFGRVQGFFVVIMLVSQLVFPILAFTGLSRTRIDYSAFTPFLRTDWQGLLQLVIIAYFLFAGFEMACPLAEEARNPARNVPRAIIGAVATVIVTTSLMGLMFVGFIPLNQLGGMEYPHMIAAEKIMGSAGTYWWLLVSFVASASSVCAVYAAVPRILYGMARGGTLPRIFAYLHPRHQSPWVGIFVMYLITLVFGILVPGWVFLFSIAAFAWISTYILVIAAAMYLRKKEPGTERPFRAPGFPVLPVIGLVAMALVLAFSGRDTLVVGGVLFLACVVYGILAVARKRGIGHPKAPAT